MHDSNSMSDLEAAMLNKTVLNICHLYLGDKAVLGEEIEKNHKSHQNKRWLETITSSGPFENRVFGLRNELTIAYKQTNTDALDPYQIFPFQPKDDLVLHLILDLTIADCAQGTAHNYIESARKIVEALGYTGGLFDEKLNELTIKDIFRKLLLLESTWWETRK